MSPIREGSKINPVAPVLDSAKIHRLLVDNLPGSAVLVFDIDLRYLSAEGNFLRSMGINPDSMIGKTLEEVLGKELSAPLEPYYRVALSGQTVSFEGKSSHGTYYASTAIPVRDEQGIVIAGMISSYDITAQKQTEIALRESEARYRLLFDNNPDGIILTGNANTLHFANAAACKIFGGIQEELQQAGHNRLIDMTSISAKMLFQETRYHDQFCGELQCRRLDGTMFPAEITSRGYFNEDGSHYIVTIIRDITKRKNAERELRESQELVRQVTTAMPDYVYVYDLVERRTLFTNRSNYGLLNYTLDELSGFQQTQFANLLHPEDVPFAREFQKRIFAAPDGEVVDGELEVRAKDGTWRWMSNRVLVFKRNENGTPRQLLVFASDVTNRRMTEIKHRETELAGERMDMLASFIHDVSHDFRTPLAVINSCAYLLSVHSASPKSKDYEAQIRLQVERLDEIINSMMLLVKLNSATKLEFTTTMIDWHIQGVMEGLMDKLQLHNQHLSLDLVAGKTAVTVNIPLIERAVDNLVKNAIQHTPDGGTITVRTGVENNHIFIEVQDTGTGIAEDDLSHIFDPLYRGDKTRSTRSGGSGLGLSITKRIIDLHQGTIYVQSTVGQGSRFRILLPLSNATNP